MDITYERRLSILLLILAALLVVGSYEYRMLVTNGQYGQPTYLPAVSSAQ